LVIDFWEDDKFKAPRYALPQGASYTELFISVSYNLARWKSIGSIGQGYTEPSSVAL
jgi:hypothetical protein